MHGVAAVNLNKQHKPRHLVACKDAPLCRQRGLYQAQGLDMAVEILDTWPPDPSLGSVGLGFLVAYTNNELTAVCVRKSNCDALNFRRRNLKCLAVKEVILLPSAQLKCFLETQIPSSHVASFVGQDSERSQLSWASAQTGTSYSQ
jgi:hypothetical protein